MAKLKRVDYIFVHTAADPREGGRRDTTAAEITAWHRARGWSTIGYHYVVRRDGTIEKGRDETEVGAHVRGMNHRSIGICLSGHHDYVPMTPSQQNALIRLLVQLCQRYQLPIHRILGHREVNQLVAAGVLDPIYQTSKSCPGRYVMMSMVRKAVAEQLEKEGTQKNDGN